MMGTRPYTEPVKRHYPSFYDRPHDRAILSSEGTGRAVLILAGLLLFLIGVALLLMVL